jgi:hypothetical protein
LDYAFFNEDSIVGLAEFLWERSFDLDTLERMRRSLTYYSKARDKRAFTPDDPLPVATTGASDLDDVYAEYMQRFFPSRSEPSRVPG